MSVDKVGFSEVAGIRALEERAQEIYSELVQSADGNALVQQGAGALGYGHEVVGIGFDVEDRSAALWFELKNTAPVDSQQFTVDGETIHNLLMHIRRSFPDGTHIRGCILWHSHYRRETPSKVDVQNFPTWLAKHGIVYHTPTQVSTAYDNSGVISRLSPSTASSLTTTGR